VGQWGSGTVEQWGSGAVGQWGSRAVGQWGSGAVEQWDVRQLYRAARPVRLSDICTRKMYENAAEQWTGTKAAD
jgi:hypothetical protein